MSTRPSRARRRAEVSALYFHSFSHTTLRSLCGAGEGQTTIYQPGSTVATSLCEGEAKRKAVGILEIYKETIRFTVRHLKTVRPFEMREVQLADQPTVDLRK